MLWHKNIGAGGIGGAASGYLGYVGDDYFEGSSSPTTQASADLGRPDANRVVVVVVPSSNGQSPSSVSIAGVTATKLGISDGTLDANIFYASVPTGSTGDIVYTHSAGDNFSATWYAIYPSSATPVDQDNVDDSLSVDTTTVTTQAGDILICCVSSRTDGTISGASWTGSATPVIDKEGMSFSEGTRNGHSISILNCDAETNGDLVISGMSDRRSILTVVWR